MKYKYYYLLIIIIIIIGYLFLKKFNIECFNFLQSYSTPPKRNVSYDLRCEPVITKKNIGIWNNSTINSFKNRCIV